MNPQTEILFASWLKLNEDEKRELVKEMMYFNNLPLVKQKAIIQKYEKQGNILN